MSACNFEQCHLWGLQLKVQAGCCSSVDFYEEQFSEFTNSEEVYCEFCCVRNMVIVN